MELSTSSTRKTVYISVIHLTTLSPPISDPPQLNLSHRLYSHKPITVFRPRGLTYLHNEDFQNKASE